MARKKKKTSQTTQKRAISKSKTVGDARQRRYKKEYRIPSPLSSIEFLKAMEEETTDALKRENNLQRNAGTSGKSKTKELLLLIADLATGLWRIDKKSAVDDIDNATATGSMRGLRRHIESTLDILTSAKVEIRDHIGEKYVTGMALKVIAFQPSSAVQIEKITETIKPSVFYKNQLIQRGEVIVETPEAEKPEQKSRKDVADEVESADESDKDNRTENE